MLMHPLEGCDLIEQSAVGRIARLGSGQVLKRCKPQDAQPVVERHHDEVVPGGERCAIIPGIWRRAQRERSARDVDRHRALLAFRARRPDLEREAPHPMKSAMPLVYLLWVGCVQSGNGGFPGKQWGTMDTHRMQGAHFRKRWDLARVR